MRWGTDFSTASCISVFLTGCFWPFLYFRSRWCIKGCWKCKSTTKISLLQNLNLSQTGLAKNVSLIIFCATDSWEFGAPSPWLEIDVRCDWQEKPSQFRGDVGSRKARTYTCLWCFLPLSRAKVKAQIRLPLCVLVTSPPLVGLFH